MTTRPANEENSFDERPAKRRFSVDVPDTYAHFLSSAQPTSLIDALDQDPFKDFSEGFDFIPEGSEASDDANGSETKDEDNKQDANNAANKSQNSNSSTHSTSNHHSNNSGPPKKRSRATPEQLAILEETFLTNTSPNAKLREILSAKVNMTERSIQIWFQNRRAKVKLMQKRAAQQAAQEQAMRAQTYLAAAYGMRTGLMPNFGMQFAPYGQIQPKLPIGRSNSIDSAAMGMGMGLNMNMGMGMSMGMPGAIPQANMMALGGGGAMNNAGMNMGMSPASSGENVTMAFTAESLCIGSWRRVPITTNDLVCSFHSADRIMRWQIIEGTSKFKMEFPFASIAAIKFEQVNAFTGQIAITLNQPPMFFMEMAIGGSSVWTQCRDFTENTQATMILTHIVKGQSQALRRELMTLCQADLYVQGITQINSGANTPSTDMTKPMMPLSAATKSSAAASMNLPQFARRHSTPNLFANQPLKRQNSLQESLFRRQTSVNPMSTLSAEQISLLSSAMNGPTSLTSSPQLTASTIAPGPASASPSLGSLPRRGSLLSSPPITHSLDDSSLMINTTQGDQNGLYSESSPDLLSDLSYINLGDTGMDPTNQQQYHPYPSQQQLPVQNDPFAFTNNSFGTGSIVDSFLDTLSNPSLDANNNNSNTETSGSGSSSLLVA